MAIVLAAMMLLCLAACDTGNDPDSDTPGTSQTTDQGDNDGGDSYAIADISANNREKVIEENFGVKITLPDGWTIQSVANPNGFSNVKTFFVPVGSET